jgi:hypothetical protein
MIPPGLKQNVPWAHSSDTVIVIMELDWYCTGAVGMKQQSCWRGSMVFQEATSEPDGKLRNRQYVIWCLITNTQANRVAIVGSVITGYLTLANIGQSPLNLQIGYVQCIGLIIFIASFLLLLISCLILIHSILSCFVWFAFVRLFSVRLFVYLVYFLS